MYGNRSRRNAKQKSRVSEAAVGCGLERVRTLCKGSPEVQVARCLRVLQLINEVSPEVAAEFQTVCACDFRERSGNRMIQLRAVVLIAVRDSGTYRRWSLVEWHEPVARLSNLTRSPESLHRTRQTMLQRLETEGLVESRPRVGTRVRVPTAQDIRGHYVVREALESQSARLFAQKATADERDELWRLAQNLDALYSASSGEEGDLDQLFRVHQSHFRFHMRIAECSGYEALCLAIERNQILIFNWLYDTAADPKRLPANHHTVLAEELCSQDVGRADAAMRAHVMYGRDEVLQTLETLYSGDRIAVGI